jgi:hypothetical protein
MQFTSIWSMNKIFTTLLLAAAIASVTAILSPTSVFAPTNNAQDDKNQDTFPGTGAGNNPNPSDQASDNTDRNCFRHEFGIVGNGQNLPAQCY